MTDLDTAAIRARLAALNWLPWRYYPPTSPDGDMMSVYGRTPNPPYTSVHMLTVDADLRSEPNLVFIAHAPTDIAALLADNAMLRALLKQAAPRYAVGGAALDAWLFDVRAALREGGES